MKKLTAEAIVERFPNDIDGVLSCNGQTVLVLTGNHYHRDRTPADKAEMCIAAALAPQTVFFLRPGGGVVTSEGKLWGELNLNTAKVLWESDSSGFLGPWTPSSRPVERKPARCLTRGRIVK